MKCQYNKEVRITYLKKLFEVSCSKCKEVRTVQRATYNSVKIRGSLCRLCSQRNRGPRKIYKKSLKSPWNKGMTSLVFKKCLYCKDEFKIEAYKVQECCSHSCAQRLRVKMGGHHFGDGSKTVLNFAVRASTKYKEWKKAVIERDGFECKECGIESKKGDFNLMDVDHIFPLAALLRKYNIKTVYQSQDCEELWDISNGRILCKECHTKTDTYAGRSNHLTI